MLWLWSAEREEKGRKFSEFGSQMSCTSMCPHQSSVFIHQREEVIIYQNLLISQMSLLLHAYAYIPNIWHTTNCTYRFRDTIYNLQNLLNIFCISIQTEKRNKGSWSIKFLNARRRRGIRIMMSRRSDSLANLCLLCLLFLTKSAETGWSNTTTNIL